MDRFLFAHNPLKESDSQVVYLLHTRLPRILISVNPIHLNMTDPPEHLLELGKIFESELLHNDLGRVLLKIEMDLQSESKLTHLSPKLELILARAYRWFVAFKMKASPRSNEHNMPDWVFL